MFEYILYRVSQIYLTNAIMFVLIVIFHFFFFLINTIILLRYSNNGLKYFFIFGSYNLTFKILSLSSIGKNKNSHFVNPIFRNVLVFGEFY